ncbi:MAG: metal ABC transporter permease [Pseudomonadota bacterium]
MFENLLFFKETIAAAILAGLSCSLIGVFIFCLRIPFIGVLISHAAMAGAIMAQFLGWPELPAALGMSFISIFFVGWLTDQTEVDLNISLGILFSLMMGLAFLGIGLIPEPKTPILSLLWGNILLVTQKEVLAMMVVAIILIGIIGLGFKELKAVLFSRTIAAALGIREEFFFYALLLLSGGVVSVNLNSIGGLMLYSLLVNPAAGAYQIAYSLKAMLVIAAFLGVGASLSGLLCSYLWSLPTGASIVICSSIEFALCAVLSPKRRKIAKGKT